MTIYHTAKELDSFLGRGRIERITMITPDDVILHIKKERVSHSLYLSSSPSSPRCCLTDKTFESPKTPFSFLMNLRKNIGGGQITSIKTLDFERVVVIEITASNDLGFRHNYTLYAEIIARQSNIILVDEDGKILNCTRHIPLNPEKNSRIILPGVKYAPPTRQADKFNIQEESELLDVLVTILPENLQSELITHIYGFAPITLKEAYYQCFIKEKNSFDKSGLTRLIKILQGFYDNETKPCVLTPEKQIIKDYFIRPYESITTGEYVSFDSVNNAAAAYFAAKGEASSHSKRKSTLMSAVNTHLKRCNKKIELFSSRIASAGDAENERIIGELITANLYKIKKGDTAVTVDNYYTGETVLIEIDPLLSPQANAQRHFKIYNKRKRETEVSLEQVTALTKEADYLGSILESFRLSETSKELDDLESELNAGSYIRKNNSKNKKVGLSAPLSITINGYNVKVGKNNLQNDKLLKNSDGGYTWLHVKGFHGSHVVIENNSPDIDTIIKAAALAAYYSSAFASENVPVDYTLVKNVKKIPNSPPGKVTYTGQQTVNVRPSDKI